jgi:tRNA pseudouridine55 synthase
MTVFGLLNINKPPGPTSHDIVAWVRRGTRVKKVGHAGTLDPLASGVLIVCLGPATRLSEYVMDSPKTYRARVCFGVETTTYDAEGDVVTENTDPITRHSVETALDGFRGTIQQVPPMYSAIKRGGQKLYELARAGQEVERPPRAVTIDRLDLLAWEPPYASLEIVCSPGTYIRSLAHDLGQAVGVGAHLAALERSASGTFTIGDSVPWTDFEAAMQAGTWQSFLLPPDRALDDAPAVHLMASEADDVRNGRFVVAERSMTGDLARAYDPAGRFLAVLVRRGDRWKPHKVWPVD